jgi:A/G-specific adenine glycosylase
MIPSKITKKKFNKNILKFYTTHKRNLLWREEINGYYILLSEFMLQQTQVNRVIDYFNRFIKAFPTIESLAAGTFFEVIELWQGLGYNRRAKYLHEAAQEIVASYQGIIPKDYKKLLAIKGIGEYTAQAIVTYTYNIPLIFIETNIRTVFLLLHKNTINKKKNKKNKIEEKIFATHISHFIDKENPRLWYYALMDFGTFLKKKNRDKHIQQAASFTKQSTFKNSFRQLRGKIIKYFIEKKCFIPSKEIIEKHNHDNRVLQVLTSLVEDNLVIKKDDFYGIITT